MLVEAHCLHFAGKEAEAAPAYEAVAVQARAEGNQNILACGLNDAATAYLNLEQFERAERYYVDALVLFDELGLATEKTRVEWSLAIVLVRRGDLATGAERLDAVRGELMRLGLLNDHALATLDWAEARLALGESSGVAEACRSIVIGFESEGMMKNARLALAYVHDARSRRRRLRRCSGRFAPTSSTSRRVRMPASFPCSKRNFVAVLIKPPARGTPE